MSDQRCDTCKYSNEEHTWWKGDYICNIVLPPWVPYPIEAQRHVDGWESCDLWKEKDQE